MFLLFPTATFSGKENIPVEEYKKFLEIKITKEEELQMAENKKNRNESGSKAVGIEMLMIEWINDGFENKENDPNNGVSGEER